MGWTCLRILPITAFQEATLTKQIWPMREKLFATLGVMEDKKRKAYAEERESRSRFRY